jgi:hypothetical protein
VQSYFMGHLNEPLRSSLIYHREHGGEGIAYKKTYLSDVYGIFQNYI